MTTYRHPIISHMSTIIIMLAIVVTASEVYATDAQIHYYNPTRLGQNMEGRVYYGGRIVGEENYTHVSSTPASESNAHNVNTGLIHHMDVYQLSSQGGVRFPVAMHVPDVSIEPFGGTAPLSNNNFVMTSGKRKETFDFSHWGHDVMLQLHKHQIWYRGQSNTKLSREINGRNDELAPEEKQTQHLKEEVHVAKIIPDRTHGQLVVLNVYKHGPNKSKTPHKIEINGLESGPFWEIRRLDDDNLMHTEYATVPSDGKANFIGLTDPVLNKIDTSFLIQKDQPYGPEFSQFIETVHSKKR